MPSTLSTKMCSAPFDNIVRMTDAYKVTHHLQYPPGIGSSKVILQPMKDAGWAADNLALRSGVTLLQKLHRDEEVRPQLLLRARERLERRRVRGPHHRPWQEVQEGPPHLGAVRRRMVHRRSGARARPTMTSLWRYSAMACCLWLIGSRHLGTLLQRRNEANDAFDALNQDVQCSLRQHRQDDGCVQGDPSPAVPAGHRQL